MRKNRELNGKLILKTRYDVSNAPIEYNTYYEHSP